MSDNQNEQSFNEDELKDIMDEIESLEEDYGEVEEEMSAAEEPAQEEAAEEVVEEVAEEVAQDEPVAEEPVVQEAVAEEPVVEDAVAAEPTVEEVQEEIVEEPVVAAADNAESDEVEQILGDDDDDEDDLETVAQPGEEAVHVQEESNVVELNHAAPASDSPVHLSAQGQMNLAMNFTFNGAQSKIVLENGCVKINLPGVDVVFDEKTGCQINADNGMTFQLPLSVKKAS